jgi:hypothetical protein
MLATDKVQIKKKRVCNSSNGATAAYAEQGKSLTKAAQPHLYITAFQFHDYSELPMAQHSLNLVC